MIAYDTSTFGTLLPSASCAGCSSMWYDESASSTFDNTGAVSTEINQHLWAGTCNNATDTICTDKDDATTCVAGLEFCLIDFELEAPYEYAGALGLGMVGSDYSAGANVSSYVEMWAEEQNQKAQVIIDSNFMGEDSFVYFGTDPLAD
jgi:hypothetical protein